MEGDPKKKWRTPPKDLRMRVCRRCSNFYQSTAKKSKFCEECKLPSGVYARHERKRRKDKIKNDRENNKET